MPSRSKYPNTQCREDGKPSVWNRYLDLLIQNRVPKAARQWHVTRARQFIDGMRPDRLSDLTLDDITGYFQKTSGDGCLNAWQFCQMVEAVHLMVVDLVLVKCGNSVDSLSANNRRDLRLQKIAACAAFLSYVVIGNIAFLRVLRALRVKN